MRKGVWFGFAIGMLSAALLTGCSKKIRGSICYKSAVRITERTIDRRNPHKQQYRAILR
ncbi:hypothetical protein [Lacrimispora xylanisolvens]|uniref:hypothetical protein n=1 Tax=Lacrimispora xylanisolvens TaxID=384636 RepID=UPI0032E800E0